MWSKKTEERHEVHRFGQVQDVAKWSRGMIPALGAGGPGFKSRFGPDSFSMVPVFYFPGEATKKFQGDTRSWTKDLPDCSRMLYHWAISPVMCMGVVCLAPPIRHKGKEREKEKVLSGMGFEPMPSIEDQKSHTHSLLGSKDWTLSLAP